MSDLVGNHSVGFSQEAAQICYILTCIETCASFVALLTNSVTAFKFGHLCLRCKSP